MLQAALQHVGAAGGATGVSMPVAFSRSVINIYCIYTLLFMQCGSVLLGAAHFCDMMCFVVLC